MKRNLSETRVMAAVQEIVEDRIADCVRHCQDVTTVEGKPCEVTVKIKITPNRSRDIFRYNVTGAAKLSPREAAEMQLYASVQDGEVEHVEYEPQTTIPGVA